MAKAKVCPNCGSAEIEYASLDKRSGTLVGLGIPEKYFCKNCGYEGGVILEIDKSKLKKIKFPHKKFASFRGPQFDFAKPILIFCLFAFIMASLFLVMPRQKTTVSSFETGPENITVKVGNQNFDILYGTKSTITGTIPNGGITIESRPTETGMEIKIITLNETNLLQEVAGLNNITGWLVYMLLIFFVIGITAILMYMNWHKVLK